MTLRILAYNIQPNQSGMKILYWSYKNLLHTDVDDTTQDLSKCRHKSVTYINLFSEKERRTTTMTKKNVLVIGAGPSGLVAMKELMEKGHDVICLEKSSQIGGAFASDKIYDTLYLTISNLLMAFSDFLPTDDGNSGAGGRRGTISYSSAPEYLNYLNEYTTHFQLWDRIRFNTKVVHAKINAETGQWNVQAEQEGKVIVNFKSDILIVATGANHEPRYIDLPGYTGEVSHAVDYRDARPFRGKNVLVVGVGESSMDMSHDIASVAKSCSVWSRRYVAFGPRFLTMVDDPTYDEAKLLQTQSQRHDKVSIFLETATTNRLAGWLPLWYYALIRQMLWKKKDKVTPFTLLADWSRLVSKDVYFRADQSGIVTKNGNLSVAHAQGTIHSIVSKTAKFHGKTVTFPNTIWCDGIVPPCEKTIEEIDQILLCTGYQTDFSWLEVDNLNWSPRSWYKHCFPPGELGNKLMFLGWTRPHQGGIPACSEMLSRYIAMLLSGERSLPQNHDQIAVHEGSLETKYYSQHPNVPVVVDLPAFLESIATIIGCLPKPPSIWNLERFGQYWLYPTWPCWYRQHGPGAKPEVLDQVLKAMPLTRSFDIDPLTILGIPVAVINYSFSFIVRCVPLVSYWYRKAGLGSAELYVLYRPRKHVLHGNDIPPVSLGLQVVTVSLIVYTIQLAWNKLLVL